MKRAKGLCAARSKAEQGPTRARATPGHAAPRQGIFHPASNVMILPRLMNDCTPAPEGQAEGIGSPHPRVGISAEAPSSARRARKAS